MTPVVARYMLKLKLDDKQRERISKLNAKANKGTLSPRERNELEQYLLISDLLTMLHLKARLALKSRAA